MTTLVEGTHPGGFLVWEAFRDYTRETITVASGTLAPGSVLGQITASGKYAAHDPNATDGTETAVAVLWGKADASGGDAPAVFQAAATEYHGLETASRQIHHRIVPGSRAGKRR